MNATTIIIAMAVGAVASGVTEKVLSAAGKMDEAAYMALATRCIMASTCIVVFVKFVGNLATLSKFVK